MHGGRGALFRPEGERFGGLPSAAAICKHLVQLTLVDFLHGGQVDTVALVFQRPFGDGVAHLLAQVAALGALNEQRANLLGEHVAVIVVVHAGADGVAQAHLEQALSHAAQPQRPGRHDGSVQNAPAYRIKIRSQGSGIVGITAQQAYFMARRLEFGRNDLAGLAGGHREGAQRGRHVHLFKGAGHAVLAADGRNVQIQLRVKGAQQRREGLAPAFGFTGHALEIFLEGQVRLPVVKARGHQPGHALHHRQIGALVGALLHQLRMEAVGHAGHGVRHAMKDGQLGHHGLVGGQLALAAKGHEHRGRADGGVEPLGQPLLGADVQAAHHGGQLFRHSVTGEGHLRHAVVGHGDAGMLLRAVGIQEFPAQVNDGRALPGHAQARLGGDLRHHGGLQVLVIGRLQEGFYILGGQHHGHALLGLGNGQLGAVQAVILLGHAVQVDHQAVGQFADGHAHAARAKVVAALDEAGHLAVAEQALQLALGGGIALLHLGAAGLDGFQLVGLGGARRAAAAVAARASAQEDDFVPGRGCLAADFLLRGRAHHRANLQALGGIPRVILLVHQARGQADLVAIGGIARRGGGHQLALGQLAGHGFADGNQRIRRAGDAHGLIHIGAPGQRVADSAADAGGRAAEGLNLRGMIVGLVFEHEQPGFLHAIHVHVDFDGAGVDFLAHVDIGGLADLFKIFAAHGRHVHQIDGAGGSALAIHGFPGRKIPAEGPLHGFLADIRMVDGGQEGGVAAVVGPVGVDHTDFRQGGVAMLGGEVIPAEGQVVVVHGQAVFLHEFVHLRRVHGGEAMQRFHMVGGVVDLLQGGLLGKVGLAALHGVDHMLFDAGQLVLRHGACEHVHPRRAHGGTVALAHQLDALFAGGGPLVVLAGEVLHSKHGVAALGQAVEGHVHLGLGKHHRQAALVQFVRYALHVIAVEKPQPGNAPDQQDVADLPQKVLGLHGVFRPLFHINALNAHA